MQERLMSILERPVLQFPDKIALIDGETRLTYREFGDRVYQLANGLRAQGVNQGDAVAALCLNHHRFIEIYFACHALGAIVVPLNIRLAAPELIYILTDSKTRVLFIDEPFLPMLEAIREGTSDLKAVYFSDHGDTPDGMKNLEELIEGQSTDFDAPTTSENDTAGYFYTGGTTGDPKGVELSERNLLANALHLQAMMRFTPADKWLHIAPMFHLADVGAIYLTTMMGATHVFGRAFEPKLTLDLIEKEGVTCTILVPTMMNFVLNHPDIDTTDLSSLRFILYGASPMPVPLLKTALEKFPCGIAQGYGMTEAAPLVTVLTEEDHVLGLSSPENEWILGTAGTVVPGVEIKIVDENDKEVAIGEAGEIVVRGPNVMKGYLNKKEATDEAIYNGWYHSGDIAVRNERGYVTIVDRMKDMIISGGENVYTTEVENVIMQYEGILETTVVGIPDEKWGEAVHAFVVMKPGEAENGDAIVSFCKERLAGFKCPKSVDFMAELPKSGAGKILKRDLRKAYWGEGARQVH